MNEIRPKTKIFNSAHKLQENEIWDGKNFSIIETPKKID